MANKAEEVNTELNLIEEALSDTIGTLLSKNNKKSFKKDLETLSENLQNNLELVRNEVSVNKVLQKSLNRLQENMRQTREQILLVKQQRSSVQRRLYELEVNYHNNEKKRLDQESMHFFISDLQNLLNEKQQQQQPKIIMKSLNMRQDGGNEMIEIEPIVNEGISNEMSISSKKKNSTAENNNNNNNNSNNNNDEDNNSKVKKRRLSTGNNQKEFEPQKRMKTVQEVIIDSKLEKEMKLESDILEVSSLINNLDSLGEVKNRLLALGKLLDQIIEK